MTASVKRINDHLTFLLLVVFQFWLYLQDGEDAIIPHVIILLFELLLFVNSTLTIMIHGKKVFFSLYFLLLILIAFVLGTINYHGEIVDVGRNSDFIICLLALNGILLINKDKHFIISLIKTIAIISCIITLYELINFDFSQLGVLVVDRSALWNVRLYKCGTFFWFVPYLLIYAIVYKDGVVIAIVAWIFAMIINSIATKRMFWVETFWGIFVVFLFLIKIRQFKQVKMIVAVAVVALIGVTYLLTVDVIELDALFEAQQERMTGDQIEATGFSRFRETEKYFSMTSPVDWIIGKGLGVAHHGLGGPNTALHIGITNIILKFGLFLLIPYLILLLKTLRGYKHIRVLRSKNDWKAFSILCVIANTPLFLLVSNFWAMTPVVTFFWYFLINASRPDKYANTHIK